MASVNTDSEKVAWKPGDVKKRHGCETSEFDKVHEEAAKERYKERQAAQKTRDKHDRQHAQELSALEQEVSLEEEKNKLLSRKLGKPIPASLASPAWGELPRFAPSVDVQKYKCCKCHGILQPPVKLTQCGHRLCSLCLDDLLHSSNPVCPGQDLDDEECVDLRHPSSVTPDFGTDRDLKRLPVLCDYEEYGCRSTPSWLKKAKHVEECEYKPQRCLNHSNGCKFMGIQSKVDEHLNHCSFALEKCPHCREDIAGAQYQAHVRECMNKPQKCPLADKGCSFQGTATAIAQHEKDPKVMAEHINLLNDYVKKIEMCRAESKTTLQQLERENQELKISLSRGAEGGGDATKIHQNLMKNYAKVSERVGNIEEDLKARPNYDIVASRGEKLTSLQDLSKMHESRITQIEQSQRSSGIGSSEEERNKLRSMESTVGMHDIRLAEYDLRFQCMESAGYDGILIWKIKDYQRRKMDAISGRTLSLDSQPFYTTPFGYKMCARVHLNGDGMGKGTHMSLFFIILKGNYDDVLPWPFGKQVTLTLMATDGSGKHLRDTFRPDPTSTSFRKPVGDMNEAAGTPMFALQADVERCGYIKDDSIYIKIAVDTINNSDFELQ